MILFKNKIPTTSPVAKTWKGVHDAIARMLAHEPFLATLDLKRVAQKKNMKDGLVEVLLWQKFDPPEAKIKLRKLFLDVLIKSPDILDAAAKDLRAIMESDPAAVDIARPFLFYKGFHAIQTHRIAHALWKEGQKGTALFLQSRSSLLYGIDIHPNAKFGKGIALDHGSGVVIGETAVVEDDVAMFHGVTLGGTGKQRGDRHPKVRKGAIISAGSTLLGNIEIGAGARVGAGSMVLRDVPAGTTVVGVPAKAIGESKLRKD